MSYKFDSKRLFFMISVGFVFTCAYDYVFHHLLLQDIYMQTRELWRSDTDIDQSMIQYYVFHYVLQLLLVVILAKLFVWGHKNQPRKGDKRCSMECFRYGVYIGLFLAVIHASFYTFMPIPPVLAVSWAVGYFIKGVVLGLIFYCSGKQEREDVKK